MNFGKYFLLIIFCISYVEFGRADQTSGCGYDPEKPQVRTQGQFIRLDERVRLVLEKNSIDAMHMQRYRFSDVDYVVLTPQIQQVLQSNGMISRQRKYKMSIAAPEFDMFWSARVYSFEEREKHATDKSAVIHSNSRTNGPKNQSNFSFAQHKTSSGGLWNLFLPFLRVFGWSKASKKSVNQWGCQDCGCHYETKTTKKG